MSMSSCSRALLAFGLLSCLVACAGQDGDSSSDDSRSTPPSTMARNAPGAHQGASNNGPAMGSAGSTAPVADPPANGTTSGGTQGNTPSADCAANATFKGEGCPCKAGETAACWT